MAKKNTITITSITLNNGTFELPKAIELPERYAEVETNELLVEILRRECEALTGESILVVYDSTEEDAES